MPNTNPCNFETFPQELGKAGVVSENQEQK